MEEGRPTYRKVLRVLQLILQDVPVTAEVALDSRISRKVGHVMLMNTAKQWTFTTA